MQLDLTVPPAYEPFTLDDLKQALRVTHDHQDDLIWDLGRSARKACEDAARFSISPQTWRARYRAPQRRGDDFGITDDVLDTERLLNGLALSRPPIVSLTDVSLVHREGGGSVVLDPVTHYNFDPTFGRIDWTREGLRWLVDPCFPNLVVEYVTGFPAAKGFNPGDNPDRSIRQVAVDATILEAIYVTASQSYDDPGASASQLPKKAVQLLRPYFNPPRMLG